MARMGCRVCTLRGRSAVATDVDVRCGCDAAHVLLDARSVSGCDARRHKRCSALLDTCVHRARVHGSVRHAAGSTTAPECRARRPTARASPQSACTSSRLHPQCARATSGHARSTSPSTARAPLPDGAPRGRCARDCRRAPPVWAAALCCTSPAVPLGTIRATPERFCVHHAPRRV